MKRNFKEKCFENPDLTGFEPGNPRGRDTNQYATKKPKVLRNQCFTK